MTKKKPPPPPKPPPTRSVKSAFLTENSRIRPKPATPKENTMLKSILINSLYVLSLVAVFFVVENRFEELEMQSMYMQCVAEELKDHKLCVTKIENEYQRSL